MEIVSFFSSLAQKINYVEVGIVLLTWFSALLGAVITFLFQREHGKPITFRGFVGFCFPREMFCRSVYLDIAYVVAFKFLSVIFLGALLVSAAVVALGTYEMLGWAFGPRAPFIEPTWVVKVAVIVVFVLERDFVVFFQHYLDHRIAWLWDYHQVHHSAEFLIPLTNRRFHPVQYLMDEGGQHLVDGLFFGAVAYTMGVRLEDVVILGMDAYFITQILCFYHLRHSHIPMRFGWLEPWLMSPAQHQIHHSLEERHWDRNFGLTFTFWDRLFGTHVLPIPGDKFPLGIGTREYDTVAALYLLPFYKTWQRIRSKLGGVAAQKPMASRIAS